MLWRLRSQRVIIIIIIINIVNTEGRQLSRATEVRYLGVFIEAALQHF